MDPGLLAPGEWIDAKMAEVERRQKRIGAIDVEIYVLAWTLYRPSDPSPTLVGE